MNVPKDVQLIGSEIAVLWDDGRESYIPAPLLRAASPSAEARGETDILGQVHGGETAASHDGVEVIAWEKVGNYALRFEFSDGHRTGLYSFDYLREIDPGRSES